MLTHTALTHTAYLAPFTLPLNEINQCFLSKDLWDNLLVQSGRNLNDPPFESIPVAITSIFVQSRTAHEEGKGETGAVTVVMFANLVKDSILKASVSQPPFTTLVHKLHRHDYFTGNTNQTLTVYIDKSVLNDNPIIFPMPTSSFNSMSPVLKLTLTRVVPLTSVVLVALNTAAFVSATDDYIAFQALVVNQGEILRQNGILLTHYRIAMTEPVQQGISLMDVTRFTILPPASFGISATVGKVIDQEEQTTHFSLNESQNILEVDLGESFLANSVLPSFTSNSPPSILVAQDTLRRPIISDSNVLPRPLKQLILSESLTPNPDFREDDNQRVYLSPMDLGKLGLFSGDWAIIDSRPAGSMRFARAFASETLSNSTHEADASTISAWFTPSFLKNLFPLSSLSALCIKPANGRTKPRFPTAVSVTVARVASPHSVNKNCQTLFLKALRKFFQIQERILLINDLIAVVIDDEEARFGDLRDGDAGDDAIELPSTGSHWNLSPTTVFFKITSLEINRDEQPHVIGYKTEYESRLETGDWGCYIDPAVTKLVQTGLERALVPDVDEFHLLPAPQLDRNVTMNRLFDYITAAVRGSSESYDVHLTVLIKGAKGAGKKSMVRAVAKKTGFHLLEMDCFDLLGETEHKTELQLKNRIDKAVTCSPCILLLKHLDALARKSQALETGQEPTMAATLRECFTMAREGSKSSGYPVIIVATTSEAEKIPLGVLATFSEELTIEAPNETERLQLLLSSTIDDSLSPDVSLRSLATQTAALVANDLVDLVRRARLSATIRSSSEGQAVNLEHLKSAGITITAFDFNLALDRARESYSESIGAPKIPNVTWDDVGGLANVKSDILDTIQLPLEHPELFANGLKKRSGILLYGPPGTGKTLLAKAVATSCSLNFFSIKGPELLNMYIGESEANVRKVFQRARDAKPCVIFFDELDSVAPKRGNQGDSGGVMDRIVSQLLAELDGMAEGKGGSDVFVIGATNRPDLLDPALLRPGRFDRMLYLGVSENHDAQLKIIQALTRKFKLDPAIDLELVASMCPFNYTGADFYALCSDAMLKAMTRKANEVDFKIATLNKSPPYSSGSAMTPQYYLAELATVTETEVLVSGQDFEAALAELVPSVSKIEMDHYAIVQQRFSGQTLNSSGSAEAEKGGDSEELFRVLGGITTSEEGTVKGIAHESLSEKQSNHNKAKEKGKGKEKE